MSITAFGGLFLRILGVPGVGCCRICQRFSILAKELCLVMRLLSWQVAFSSAMSSSSDCEGLLFFQQTMSSI